jgi:UDP-2,3-diacylglucosamine hydrolase
MARSRVLFAGDVHLHPARPDIAARFERFLEAEAADATALHLVGDLFETWVSPRQAGEPFYARALAAIRRVAAAGCLVTFTPGNRDFLLDERALARAGAARRPLWHEVRLGDTFVLVTHGDLLCTRDRPYQRMRAVLRLPLVTALSRALPLAVTNRIAGRLRHTSSRAVARKAPRTYELAPEAIRRVLADGRHDVLVCGHVHRPGEGRIRVAGRTRRVLVVPEWDSAAGWVEWSQGRLRVVRADLRGGSENGGPGREDGARPDVTGRGD